MTHITIEKEKLEQALDAFIELLQRSENFHTADVHFKDFAVAKDAMESSRAAITDIKEVLAQPEQDKERCVGCEACIDTACGRDECPKGWPKASQPEQESVAEAVNVPRDLIGAACSAIEHKRDAPNVLEKLRRYTVGDLSLTTKPQRKPWASLSEKEVEDICKSLWSGGWRQKAFNDFSKLHDAKLRELNEAPAKPLTDEQWMIEMVDAAMVATRDIVPRITRSQCRLIIEAAHGIKE